MMTSQDLQIKKLDLKAEGITWISRNIIELPRSYFSLCCQTAMMIRANRHLLRIVRRIEADNLGTEPGPGFLEAQEKLAAVTALLETVLREIRSIRGLFPLVRILEAQAEALGDKLENFTLASDPELRGLFLDLSEKTKHEQAAC